MSVEADASTVTVRGGGPEVGLTSSTTTGGASEGGAGEPTGSQSMVSSLRAFVGGQPALSTPPVLRIWPVSTKSVVTPPIVTWITGFVLETWVVHRVGSQPRQPAGLVSEPSKFAKPVWVRMRLCPAGIVCVPQSAKCRLPMSTVTVTPVSAAPEVLSTRMALESHPPLALSGWPTKTTLGEPCHGIGV